MRNRSIARLMLLVAAFGALATASETMPDTNTVPVVMATTNGTVRWTSYYISTNEYSDYLHKEFQFKSEIPLSKELEASITSFFQMDYKNTYSVLKLTTHDEDQVYDVIEEAYHQQELFNTFQEYMEMMTELERMGSHIFIHNVEFKRITVKSFEDNILTVEAIWTIHATLQHVTHNHDQQNANCVLFKVQVSENNDLKIKSSKVVSIDRFNLYQ